MFFKCLENFALYGTEFTYKINMKCIIMFVYAHRVYRGEWPMENKTVSYEKKASVYIYSIAGN